MAETQEQQEAGGKLYTLSEISKLTGVSMPTLQRYKKTYQERIPSVGEGRRQRYPESSLPVFNELKVENAGRRGRPRKDASAPAAPRGRKPAARKSSVAAKPARSARGGQTAARRGRPPAAGRRGPAERRQGGRNKDGLLTLTQISKETGISYPTLVRYVRLHSDRLPHEGTGRSRRFYPKAVDAFRALRQESGRGERRRGPASAGGVRADAGLARQIQAIEKSQRALEKKLDTLLRGLKKAFS